MSGLSLPGVYLIYCHANKKAYVGSSKKICVRLGRHRYDLRNGKHGNQHLQNAWNLYGEDEFSMGVLQNCDLQETIKYEQFWLDIWRVSQMAFNRQPFAGSAKGVVWTEEERLAASIRHKANPVFKGRHHTDESKLLISQQAKERFSIPENNPFYGKTHSAETREKQGLRMRGNTYNKGKPFSEEAKLKVSAANKGKQRSAEWKASVSEFMRSEKNPRRGKKQSQEHIDKSRTTRAINRAAGLHKPYEAPSQESKDKARNTRAANRAAGLHKFSSKNKNPD